MVGEPRLEQAEVMELRMSPERRGVNLVQDASPGDVVSG
jgi:hypothetical protein